MIEPSPYSLVSEETQTKYDRAKWEYDSARAHYLEMWQALMREAYARQEMADAHIED